MYICEKSLLTVNHIKSKQLKLLHVKKYYTELKKMMQLMENKKKCKYATKTISIQHEELDTELKKKNQELLKIQEQEEKKRDIIIKEKEAFLEAEAT
ncbi:hypothetical protein NPIL_468131 [Nephila pilipes]|uniref:Uncharacterized protein n=1 Tax=Nephila pilipes TaxID=299642 RepID=A0A8X6PHP5_NEPPI|nr:hypothetical protein NPIL_468131 [Nephila pilipes]